MRPEVRDAINNINRVMQEIKYINASSNVENVLDRTLENLDEQVAAEAWENLSLIYRVIAKVHNAGTPEEYIEKYYYLSDKDYDDIDEFKNDFMIFD